MWNTILVTGGCGFIGSHFLRLARRRWPQTRVINLDALTYAGNPDNLADLASDPGYEFVQGDICDGRVVERLMKQADAVVHFAAETHVDRSLHEASIFVRTNVLGTQVLLEAAHRNRIKRFVHVSTDEVYGSRLEGHFTEESPLNPSSPYSASKAASDLLALSYYTSYGLPVMVTRCSNNYGPYQYPEKLLPVMIACALQEEPLPVYGDGLYVRDWLYVEDHCEAIAMVLEKGRVGEVYNIGADNEWRNLDLVRLVLKLLNKPEDLIRHVTDRPGHDRRYAIDSSKLRNELSWRPRMAFDEGLRRTIEWYRSHQEWIRSSKERSRVVAV